MKMKEYKRSTYWNKFVSVFSAVIILFTSVSEYVAFAEEDYTLQVLTFVTAKDNDGTTVFSEEKMIVLKDKSDELYMCVSDLSKNTIFEFNASTSTFYFDGCTPESKNYKCVYINTKKQQAEMLGSSIKLPNIFTVGEEIYLPMSILLPCLNAAPVCNGGKLIICSDATSLWKILGEVNVDDYYFDIDANLYGGVLGGVYVSSGYFLDVVTTFRYDRLLPLHGAASHYKEILRNYIVLDDSLSNSMESVIDTSDGIFTVTEFVQFAGNYAAKGLRFFEELDLEDGYHVFGGRLGLITQYADEIFNGFGKKLESLADGYTILSLASKTVIATQKCLEANQDCIDSLDVVEKYSMNKRISNSLDTIQDQYCDKRGYSSAVIDSFATEVSSEIGDKVLDWVIEKPGIPVSVKIFAGVYKAFNFVMGISGLKDLSKNASNLFFFNNLQITGYDAVKEYSASTKHTMKANEDLRLSLIFYLRMSKECNRVLEEAYRGSGVSDMADSFKEKRERIDELTAQLLLANESAYLDSTDRIRDTYSDARKQIKMLSLADYSGDLGEPISSYQQSYIASIISVSPCFSDASEISQSRMISSLASLAEISYDVIGTIDIVPYTYDAMDYDSVNIITEDDMREAMRYIFGRDLDASVQSDVANWTHTSDGYSVWPPNGRGGYSEMLIESIKAVSDNEYIVNAVQYSYYYAHCSAYGLPTEISKYKATFKRTMSTTYPFLITSKSIIAKPEYRIPVGFDSCEELVDSYAEAIQNGDVQSIVAILDNEFWRAVINSDSEYDGEYLENSEIIQRVLDDAFYPYEGKNYIASDFQITSWEPNNDHIDEMCGILAIERSNVQARQYVYTSVLCFDCLQSNGKWYLLNIFLR